MAGDWIKVSEDLHEKPEVLRMASMLKTRPEHIAGYCVKFWAWLSRQSGDGCIRGVTLDSLESVLGLPHFLSMMRNVGWLEYIEDATGPTILIPNFDRHLSESAKKRANSAAKKRQQRATDPQKDVPNVSPRKGDKCPRATGTREEKSRVEKRRKNKTPLPPYSETFESFWTAYPSGRKTGKGAAWKAWQDAVRGEPSRVVQQIIASAAEYAASSLGQSEYVKGPTPWLNQRCWEDDRAAWNRQQNNGQPMTDEDKARANRAAEKAKIKAMEARNAN